MKIPRGLNIALLIFLIIILFEDLSGLFLFLTKNDTGLLFSKEIIFALSWIGGYVIVALIAGFLTYLLFRKLSNRKK
jgi:hypothetical protein